jgi:hypothetical protein
MGITLELTPEEEARLQAAATREGLAPAEFVRRVLNVHLTPTAETDPTLALFAA